MCECMSSPLGLDAESCLLAGYCGRLLVFIISIITAAFVRVGVCTFLPFNISPPALPLVIPGLRFMILHYICLVTLIQPSHKDTCTHMQTHTSPLHTQTHPHTHPWLDYQSPHSSIHPCLVYYGAQQILIFSFPIISEVFSRWLQVKIHKSSAQR